MRKIQFASCIALCMVVPFLLNGCNDEPVDPVVSTENVTGLSLKLDAGADTAQIKLEIKEVACGTEQLNPAFYAEKVFDVSGPNHSIKDEFFVVEPGCYDVIALPYQADGITPSELCEPMGVEKVVVIDGKTTEIGLIGQCKGKEAGGLDVFVLFNIPPVITDLSFDPDKFLSYCSTQEICAEFFDPDGDKVELEWKQVSGIPLLSGPTPIPGSYSYDPGKGISKECVSLVHGGPGTVGLEVKAFDLMKDADGNDLRVDSLLKQLGYAPGSSDSLLFPSHAMASSNCPCVPNAFPEQCDLVDNDCDEQNNEDVVPACVCNPFEMLNCYTGPAGTEGVGLCRIGAHVCALDGSAFGSACVDEVLPSWEVCDGEDNDCDGLVDESYFAICTKTCNPGTIESCNNYTGPLGTEGVGTCKSGTRTCNATGVGWSACTNPVEPAAEVCGNMLDEDCSGLADDGASCNGGGCGDSVCDPGETCNSCSADCGPCPVLSCTNVCFEGDGAGNYQASGPYDTYKTVINVAGDYEYWLCDAALGCSDYPNGCVYGGIHTGPTNCPAAGTVESQVCNGSTLELNYHDGSCCFYQGSQANAPACTGCMNPLPAGTLLNQSCQGYSLIGNFADGACGSYSASIEACSIVCGRPDAGTLVSSSCSGSNLVGTYNDGNCSTYTQVIEYSSAQCAVCGNGVCEAGENNANCAMDCPPVIVCGNGVCEAGESNANCPADCVPSAVCGNSYCEAGESKASCPGDCGGGFCNICFESDAAGNYQASGPYDTYKNTLNANGDYEYWLCSNALGCSDYPGGCSYGGIHTGATNCPAWGSIESTACVGTTRQINFHNGDCCYYQGIEYNSPFCP